MGTPWVSGRRLLLVVGVYRSGTSLLAGILGQLGLHIPQPEVEADETNPRGFSEPRWVVDFHKRLLDDRLVTTHDARPAALELTRALSADDEVYTELRDWLRPQLGTAGELVVKDPRNVWFLPLWTRCAADLGVETSFATTLRHPAETLISARRAYGEWQTDASRAAAWVNLMLETERATRGAGRVFVRYEDLLADWAAQVRRMGERLELPALAEADRSRHPGIDEFVDPSLHRNRERWDGLVVPAALREMAEHVWTLMQSLSGSDAEADTARFDAARAGYDALYADAERIAQSSIVSARARRPPPPRPPLTLRRIAGLTLRKVRGPRP
jgi:hypothetical protein